MAKADDILYAPIGRPGWLLEYDDFVQIAKRQHGLFYYPYPDGALSLLQLLDRYYRGHQSTFWEAGTEIGITEYTFGGLEKTPGLNDGYFHLRWLVSKTHWVRALSIVDSNLWRNDYNDHFVFRDLPSAESWHTSRK